MIATLVGTVVAVLAGIGVGTVVRHALDAARRRWPTEDPLGYCPCATFSLPRSAIESYAPVPVTHVGCGPIRVLPPSPEGESR